MDECVELNPPPRHATDHFGQESFWPIDCSICKSTDKLHAADSFDTDTDLSSAYNLHRLNSFRRKCSRCTIHRSIGLRACVKIDIKSSHLLLLRTKSTAKYNCIHKRTNALDACPGIRNNHVSIVTLVAESNTAATDGIVSRCLCIRLRQLWTAVSYLRLYGMWNCEWQRVILCVFLWSKRCVKLIKKNIKCLLSSF